MGEDSGKNESLNIFGDFYLAPDGATDVLDEVKEDLSQAKFNLVNFEGPLFESGDAVSKTGPNLKQHPGAVEVLAGANISKVCLSNNHILDYGNSNLEYTISRFKDHNFDIYGLNEVHNESFNLGGRMIKIINISEDEWQSHYSSKVHSENLVDTAREILEAKKHNSYNILIYHGGLEHQRFPSSSLIKKLCFYIELGIDLICVHHAHCFTGMKVVKGKKIYFGLGNFFFSNFAEKHQGANIGIGVEVSLKNDKLFSRPFFLKSSSESVRFLKGEEERVYQKQFDTFSEVLNNEEALKERQDSILTKLSQNYLNYINPVYRPNRFIRHLNKFLTKRKLKILYNLVRNESHREMLLLSIKKYLKR